MLTSAGSSSIAAVVRVYARVDSVSSIGRVRTVVIRCIVVASSGRGRIEAAVVRIDAWVGFVSHV
jgi:hypothetical protein